MKTVLGMIVKNELPMLKRTAPVNAIWTDKLAIDFESTDGTREYLQEMGWHVIITRWQDDYGLARNILAGEGKNFDAMVMLDADECFDSRDVVPILRTLRDHTVLKFPRLNFYGDYELVPFHYPDYQIRAFHLNQNYQFVGKVHEGLHIPANLAPYHIYHYTWCRDSKEIALKYRNYELIAAGKPTVTEWDGPFILPHEHYPFYGHHPLQP